VAASKNCGSGFLGKSNNIVPMGNFFRSFNNHLEAVVSRCCRCRGYLEESDFANVVGAVIQKIFCLPIINFSSKRIMDQPPRFLGCIPGRHKKPLTPYRSSLIAAFYPECCWWRYRFKKGAYYRSEICTWYSKTNILDPGSGTYRT